MKSPVRRKSSGAASPKTGRRAGVSAKDSQVLAGFRDLIARGATLREASRRLGPSPMTLLRLGRLHGLPLRRRQIAPLQARRIATGLAREESLRVIARLAEVSASTVHRRKQASLGKGPKACAPWRCPGCGRLIKFDPSVCCGVAKPKSDKAERAGGRS